MSKMRTLGVKRAVAEMKIKFSDDGTPQDVNISSLSYHTTYDEHKAAISDPVFLAKIRSTGLERALRDLAMQGAANGAWTDVTSPRPVPFTGAASVEFYDNPWLPFFSSPIFVANNPA